MLDRKAMAALRCSYKKATAMICAVNIIVVLFILQFLLLPRSHNHRTAASTLHHSHVYGLQEASRIQESYEIRNQDDLHELVQRVKEINLEAEEKDAGPAEIRAKATSEIVQRLHKLQAFQNQTTDPEGRKTSGNGTREISKTRDEVYRAIAQEEVAKLAELGWFDDDADRPVEEPVEEEYVEVELENGIIPGRKLPPECNAEAHTDYDGVAVRWGLTHHTESAADCCQACLNQAKYSKPGEIKCNIWVFCAAENGCYSPDIYEHRHQECWLKQADQPRLNFKGHYQEEYRQTHPNAPLVVPWVSGVINQ